MTYNEKIINLQTGEETIRQFTSKEITELEAIKNKFAAEQVSNNLAKQAVLDKLGLSADEVAALLG